MFEITTVISTYLIPLGVFAAACAYIISQWRSGGSKASIEVIATYREQVSQLKQELADQAKEHTQQMTALTAQVGEMKGQMNAKDTQIAELKTLLLDKSPEMIQFYKQGLDFFRETHPVLLEIKQHLAIHK